MARPPISTTAELLQTIAGFKMTHVPYRGSTPMIADLLGNQIDIGADLVPTQIPQLKAGRYAGLALTSPARSAALPDLPTVAESGFPDRDRPHGTRTDRPNRNAV